MSAEGVPPWLRGLYQQPVPTTVVPPAPPLPAAGPIGCICPPGANLLCGRWDCPRKPFNAKATAP